MKKTLTNCIREAIKKLGGTASISQVLALVGRNLAPYQLANEARRRFTYDKKRGRAKKKKSIQPQDYEYARRQLVVQSLNKLYRNHKLLRVAPGVYALPNNGNGN